MAAPRWLHPVLSWFHSPPWDQVVYWALDLETTGLEASRHHVVSVGMVPVRSGVVCWGERFYSLIRPPTFDGLDDGAIAVHHIVPEDLHRAPSLAETLPEIARRLDEGALLLHHAPMDLSFLRRAFRDHTLPWPSPPVVDTRVLLSRLEDRLRRLEPHRPPLPRALDDVRAWFGLPEYDHHHALADAQATAELFLALRHRLDADKLRHLTR